MKQTHLLPTQDPVIAFDTEATSLMPGQICQLAYLMVDGGTVAGKNFFFSVDEMSESAGKVHGLTVEQLAVLSGGRRFSDSAAEILCDFSRAHLLIGHHVSFDIRYLRTELERLGLALPVIPDFCTMRRFTGVVTTVRRQRGGKYKPPSLMELCEFCGFSPDCIAARAKEYFACQTVSPHDARFDAAAAWLCARKLGG